MESFSQGLNAERSIRFSHLGFKGATVESDGAGGIKQGEELVCVLIEKSAEIERTQKCWRRGRLWRNLYVGSVTWTGRAWTETG